VHVLILALDTSSPSGSIAALENGRLIGLVSSATDEAYSCRIFRQLHFLLNEVSLTLARFDVFAVNAGPGSFTGLRVGLTAAKGWGEAFGRPLVAVSGLEAVAAQVGGGPGVIVPVLDARRGQCYVAAYEKSSGLGAEEGLARTAEEAVLTAAEFAAWLAGSDGPSDACIATPDATWLKALLSTQDLGAAPARMSERISERISEVSPVLAPVIGRLAYGRALRGETVDALRLDANYVRRSDAELKWKEQ